MSSIPFDRAMRASSLTVVLCAVVGAVAVEDGMCQIPASVAAVNLVANLDHDGEVELLKSGAEEVAYRLTFPNLTKDFRLDLANKALVIDQVWVLSDTLDMKDYNHRVDALIDDTGGLVITVRTFSKPGDARLANRGTADFDHYFCLATRLGDLSFRVLLK